MKTEFILDLDTSYTRPVTEVHGINALIDTGAEVPVFTFSEKDLNDLFNAKRVVDDVSFTGFEGLVQGSIYIIERLHIGTLIYPNMHVFVPKTGTQALKIVLPAPMFNGLIYEVDTVNHKMTVKVPDNESVVRNLVIRDKNGKLYVLCAGAQNE